MAVTRRPSTEHAVPAPLDRGHEPLSRVLVRGPPPGAGPGAAPRAHPHIVLVEPGVAGAAGQGVPSSISGHRLVNSGKVLPTVAGFSTSMPGTASPSTAAAITSRWSS